MPALILSVCACIIGTRMHDQNAFGENKQNKAKQVVCVVCAPGGVLPLFALANRTSTLAWPLQGGWGGG